MKTREELIVVLKLTDKQKQLLDDWLKDGDIVIINVTDCWSCGKEQEDSQMFCVNCGACLS